MSPGDSRQCPSVAMSVDAPPSWSTTIIARARVKSSRDFRADPGAFARFFLETFPAICYRAWRWWAGVGVAFVVLTALVAWWTATHPAFVSSVLSPEEISARLQEDGYSYEVGTIRARLKAQGAGI